MSTPNAGAGAEASPAMSCVQRLVPADADAYRAFMLEAYARHPQAYTSGAEEREALPLAWWQARLAEGDRPVQLVLAQRCDGALAGVAGLAFETRPRLRHKALLFGMCVTAPQRRNGIGRRLVEALLAQAWARDGVEQVQLSVTQGNTAAQALYEGCGFRAWGIEPHAVALGSGYLAKIHMACARAVVAPARGGGASASPA